jgi:hypothetical protein
MICFRKKLKLFFVFNLFSKAFSKSYNSIISNIRAHKMHKSTLSSFLLVISFLLSIVLIVSSTSRRSTSLFAMTDLTARNSFTGSRKQRNVLPRSGLNSRPLAIPSTQLVIESIPGNLGSVGPAVSRGPIGLRSHGHSAVVDRLGHWAQSLDWAAFAHSTSDLEPSGSDSTDVVRSGSASSSKNKIKDELPVFAAINKAREKEEDLLPLWVTYKVLSDDPHKPSIHIPELLFPKTDEFSKNKKSNGDLSTLNRQFIVSSKDPLVFKVSVFYNVVPHRESGFIMSDLRTMLKTLKKHERVSLIIEEHDADHVQARNALLALG